MPMVTIRKYGCFIGVVVLCATLSAGDVKVGPISRKPNSPILEKPKPTNTTTNNNTNSDQDTFTEPYRTIQVATTEMGILRERLVREGDIVELNQPLAKLDDELANASLEIAKQNVVCRGALNSAEAELRLQSSRVEKLHALLNDGNAHPEEFERAVMEKDVAAARVLTAQETLIVRKLELERIRLELDRRTIRSPLRGVVTKVHREVGEFVAPNDPVVMTVVQLDPLLATFSLPPAQAQQLRPGRSVPVQFASSETPIEGEVELIAPVTDARSGTIRVKVKIPNAQGQCRSGERCSLLLNDRPTTLSEKARPAERSH